MKRTLHSTLLNVLLVCACAFLSVSASAVEKVHLQGLFSNKAVINIDGKNRVLSIGQTSPEGVTLVSIDEDKVTLKFDNVTRQYGMDTEVGMNYKIPESVEETYYADDRGMFLVIGTINSLTVRFLIDTGATTISMNRSQAAQLGIHYRLNGEVTGVSTASGYVKAYRVKLKSVSLGKITQKNVEALVIDGRHPGPILLGMSFLGNLKVEKTANSLVIKQRK
jgi:aspartyl protease family protein